jgi:thiamine pyrophosphokinase
MDRNPKSALILAHGDRPSYELLLHLSSRSGLFLATDGAANELKALGLNPDVVFGDFDSIAADLTEHLPNAEFVKALNQEASDLDKAIAYIISRGFETIRIAGASGGRMDHTLGNASLLFKYLGKADIRIIDDRWEAWAVGSGTTIAGNPGDTLSLVVFEPVEWVTLSGVMWPLRGERLMPGSRGVSNEMTVHEAVLEVRGGTVIVIHQPRLEWGFLGG